ncbi:response regulator transcription factor [Shouchella patagoniensis]|uniref:response regulator transcription factor n=1 Tax=Shouchella patagoniensis TaxID=228576 RepID=UPI0009957324|nr:response regulator transcription factor [Shouchella patagoniensis]
MNVLIVDDDPLVRQSLKLLLDKENDLHVIALAANGKEALRHCEKKVPDAILMDIRMPVMDGIECTKRIKEEWPHVYVMMLTTFKDEKNIRRALQVGASGYLLKSSDAENMATQLRALHSGGSVLDKSVLNQLLHFDKHAHLQELTDREKQIVSCVGEGLSNKEIADKLYLSTGTVRNTLSVILEKLELRDRTQLAIYYWKRE